MQRLEGEGAEEVVGAVDMDGLRLKLKQNEDAI